MIEPSDARCHHAHMWRSFLSQGILGTEDDAIWTIKPPNFGIIGLGSGLEVPVHWPARKSFHVKWLRMKALSLPPTL